MRQHICVMFFVGILGYITDCQIRAHCGRGFNVLEYCKYCFKNLMNINFVNLMREFHFMYHSNDIDTQLVHWSPDHPLQQKKASNFLTLTGSWTKEISPRFLHVLTWCHIATHRCRTLYPAPPPSWRKGSSPPLRTPYWSGHPGE